MKLYLVHCGYYDHDVAEDIDDGSGNQILSHVHRAREGLQNEMIAIAIGDHAGKSVAFAPDDATQFWIDVSSVPVLGSLRDATSEEINVEILPAPRETARYNL